MAVAYASSATTTIAIANPIVISKPSGLAVGDLMVAFVGGLLNAITDYQVPTGWTAITGQSNGAESCRAFYKVADSADVAASNFSFSTNGTEYIGGGIARITGHAALFTNFSTQIETAGVFNTADLTPDGADSLLLFMTMYLSTTSGVSGYACATSNPTWTEAWDFHSTAPASDYGMSFAYANRPEITSTGDFSCGDNGQVMGIFMSLAPVINATATPDVMTLTSSVLGATVTGGASASIGEIYTTFSVPAPSVTTPTPTWSNTQKSSTTWTNTPKS